MVDFVGRHAELNLLQGCLARARDGRPQVVLIEGPAGIGKTALMERLLTDCAADPGVVVLRASGDEGEQLLAYGVLRQIERAAAGSRSAGPDDAGTAAEPPVPQPYSPFGSMGEVAGAGGSGAVGDGGDGGDVERLVDPITAGTGWLGRLDAMSGSVVVLAIDDVHWVDRPSLQALVFAVRRLVADRVLVLFAARTGDGAAEVSPSLRKLIDGPGGSAVRLTGLDESELSELARDLGVDGVGAGAVRRLLSGTGGNPLYARAILDEFPVADWVRSRDEDPLPAPSGFRRVVRERYAACAASTRRLVDAVAVLGQRASIPDAVALAGGPAGGAGPAPEIDPVATVDEAAAHELLKVGREGPPWSVEFTHPLVRAAIYDALGPARRVELHVAAAALSSDEAVRLRHRVAAAVGPDERLAADLTDFAERAQRRLDWKSAAAHLVSASRLSPDPDVARSRVLWALVWTMLRGDAAAAADYADEVAGYPPGAMRDLVLGSLAMADEEPDRAGRLLDRAWQSRAEDEAESAAIALVQAIHCYGRLDAHGTMTWSERAIATIGAQTADGPGAGTSIHPVSLAYLAYGLGYAGRVEESLAAADAQVLPVDGPLDLWLNPRSARGVLHLVDDDFDSAAAVLGAVAGSAGRLGILNTTAFSLAYLARAEWMSGRWDDALLHADRAVATNLESDFGFLQAAVVGIAVLVPGARGDWPTAEEYLRVRPRAQVRYERSMMALGLARARLGEARGRPRDVLAALGPIAAFAERDAVDEPGFWPWPDLYADALVAVGRAAEADGFLTRHEALAADRGRATAQARVARARGRIEAALGRVDTARASFDRALELVARVPAPFERARIELAAGEVLRGLGDRRGAVRLLLSARDAFAALGAAPYADRCDAELAAAGLAAGPAGALRFGLTAQELVVARRAADGLSNRAIAADLVVSIKTVEFHLRNAFAKLGVSSRRELGDRLADLPDGPG